MSDYLYEHLHVLQVFAVPLIKGLEQLQAVALWVDIHSEASAISWGVLICVLAWVKVTFR